MRVANQAEREVVAKLVEHDGSVGNMDLVDAGVRISLIRRRPAERSWRQYRLTVRTTHRCL